MNKSINLFNNVHKVMCNTGKHISRSNVNGTDQENTNQGHQEQANNEATCQGQTINGATQFETEVSLYSEKKNKY